MEDIHNIKFTIPKEIKTSTKLVGNIYLKDLGILILSFGISYFFLNSFVHGAFQILFLIYTLFITILLIFPSNINKNKRLVQTLVYFFKSELSNSKYGKRGEVKK